ncbi:MAG: hypothetical protein ACRD02_14805, partial [Acidimicrobiia bacterium]
ASGVGDWVNDSNAALARTTAQAHKGTASLQMTASSAAAMRARTASGTSGHPVEPNTQYTARAQARTAVTARSVRVLIRWYDSGGALITTATGSSVTDGINWNAAPFATAVSPANAAFATVVLEVLSASSSEVHYFDAISLRRGSDTTWYRGGLLTNALQVEYSDDAGVTWKALRGSPFTPNSHQEATVYDHESRGGVARRYRALSSTTSGNILASAASASSADATVTVTAWSLKDPLDAARNMYALPLKRPYNRTRPERAGIFSPLSRPTQVVVSDVTVQRFRAQLSFVVTLAERTALFVLLDSQRVLLCQGPNEHRYLRVVGDVVDEELAPARRRLSAEAVEAEAP